MAARNAVTRKQLYVVVHTHEYGQTVYLVWSDHVPSEEEIVDQVLQSAYEPDNDEQLTIEEKDLGCAMT